MESLYALSSDWFSVCPFVSDEVPGDLSGRLYHLEVMLKQLNTDLEKVSPRSTHLQLSPWVELRISVLILSPCLSFGVSLSPSLSGEAG